MKRIAAFVVLLSAGSMIGACASDTGSAERGRAGAGFVNKVWRVSESSAVAPGTLYVFLSEGTLLITAEHSKPALGRWTQEGGALTMVEESIAYKVDILNLTDDEFSIRSHNPGGSVEIRLVPAHRISEHGPTK
jgi:hypothetical protein